MSIKQLDHLNLTVRNLAETVAWYYRVFGFEVVESGLNDYGRWAIVRSGEAMLCLYERPELVPADHAAYHDSLDHKIHHMGFRITDRDAWKKSIKDNEIEVMFGGATAWPHSVSWYIRDPSGYQIEVVYWHNETIKFDDVAAA